MVPEAVNRMLENMTRVMVGKRDVLELTVVALLCEGHILI